MHLRQDRGILEVYIGTALIDIVGSNDDRRLRSFRRSCD
jgi:hypothetical protein